MADLDLIYVIGAPGVGKTTAVGELVGGTGWTEYRDPIPHLRRGDVVMPGRARVPFGGTDTLAMNVARKAEAWIASRPAPLVIGEGDRLCYTRFFNTAESEGYRLHLIALYLDDAGAEARRLERARALGGKTQNPAWVRGRVAKVANTVAAFGAHVVDAYGTPAEVAAEMRRWLEQGGVSLTACDRLR